MAIQHQNALREIAARVSDLYAKVSTVIWADVKEHAVPDTLLNNIKSEAQHLKESLDKAMGLGLEDIIRSQRQAADHLYRMFSLALEQIANSPDPGTTKQLCMQEQLSLGLVRVINELFSKGLISQQYISDQFRSDEDPSGAMGLKVLTDRAWNS
ncbi:MAG TPA: hypothetical protein VG966_01315 [Hyphomicrobiaceae bacterium]|nr:hypothetical protein [Hyphomicrobiaceae bacterium]